MLSIVSLLFVYATVFFTFCKKKEYLTFINYIFGQFYNFFEMQFVKLKFEYLKKTV